MINKILILATIASFISCSHSAPDRSPSSKLSELPLLVVYNGQDVVLSENVDEINSGVELRKDLAVELCQKIGAHDGSFEGAKIVDFGHRGPDWAAVYSSENGFRREKKQQFLSASRLICVFPSMVSCNHNYRNYTLSDITIGGLRCE